MKHILLASAALDLKNIPKERQIIRQSLSSKIGKFLQLETLPDVTFNALFDVFERNEVQNIEYLHYCGHSSKYGIVGTALTKDGQVITSDDLVKFLGKHEKLKVVFLNSCSSDYIGDKLVESGHVEIVIETIRPVGDLAALNFAEAFYITLANGDTIQEAFDTAKNKLKNDENIQQDELRTLFPDESEGDGFSWKLSVKDDKPADWRLFQPFSKIGNDGNRVKVLSLFQESTEYQDYHEGLKNALIKVTDNKAEVLSYPELITQGEGLKEVLPLFDSVVIFCGGPFIDFWDNHLKIAKDELKQCRIALLNCNGNAEDVKTTLKENEIPLFIKNEIPEGHSTLKRFKPVSPPFEMLISKMCIDEINKLGTKIGKISSKEIANTLKDGFIDLNYESQREPFKNPTFSPFNLFLIEGTNDCAHELLIKRILGYVPEEKILSESKISKISVSGDTEEIIEEIIEDTVEDIIEDVLSELDISVTDEMEDIIEEIISEEKTPSSDNIKDIIEKVLTQSQIQIPDDLKETTDKMIIGIIADEIWSLLASNVIESKRLARRPDPEKICNEFLESLKVRNMIIILNDLQKNTKWIQAILKVWEVMQTFMSTQKPKKKLFIFGLNQGNDTEGIGIWQHLNFNSKSDFRTEVLLPISSLEETTLSDWYTSAPTNRIKADKRYAELSSKFTEVLQSPRMAKVIGHICKHFECSEITDHIITIKTRQ